MTTNSVTHTPTPWNLHRHYEGELMAVPENEGRPAFVAASLVISRGEQIIAEVKMQRGAEGGFPTVESQEEMRANACHILEARNHHARLHADKATLVEALERLTADAEESVHEDQPIWQSIKLARAALQSAKG